jgi:hypothetical protein
MRIEFTLTQEDFIAGCRVHSWRRYSPGLERLQRILQPIAAALIILSAIFLYRWHSPLVLVAFEVVCGLYLLAAPSIIAPYLWRRLYCRTRGKDGPIVLTITDESIHIDCPGRSVGTIEWPAILGVFDRPAVTLLYLSPAQPLMVPRRVLTGAMHEEFLAICQSKGIPLTYPKPAKNLPRQVAATAL